LAAEILGAEVTAERLKAAEREPRWIDAALWGKLADANLLGVAIPERFGGMGMGIIELCVLVEQGGAAGAPRAKEGVAPPRPPRPGAPPPGARGRRPRRGPPARHARAPRTRWLRAR